MKEGWGERRIRRERTRRREGGGMKRERRREGGREKGGITDHVDVSK